MTANSSTNEIIKELDQRKQQFEEALSSMKSSLMEEGALTKIIEQHPPYAMIAECFLVGFSIREKLKKVQEHV